jgi:MoxR-like ATPase
MDLDLHNYRPLPVRYELRYAVLKKLRAGEDPLPDIDGREETKRDVVRAVLSCSHPYLVSREGTGKTRLAESLAKLLPPVPKVKGCPYNCDPNWPRDWQCPRCRESEDPAEEFGVELISGKQRYSRIQGNEYTNEAKILGVKDIQAIIQGGSPTDPRAFIGTGVLRGNRGVVCVDELPAIPTKVQVLFHPMLQEGKIILEEYNWVRPIDIFFVATGNPTGFAHVNRIPEPLLDRLELIPMGLPDEPVEREIMFKERFMVSEDFFAKREEPATTAPLGIKPQALHRRAAAPWWITDVINKTSRYTRDCPSIERGASIRGGIKALDHTCSSTEMRNGSVSTLVDAAGGLKLALRGRIRLRADLIGFDERPSELVFKHDLVVEDVMWHAVHDVGSRIVVGLGDDLERDALGKEVHHLLSMGCAVNDGIKHHPLVSRAVSWMDEAAPKEGAPTTDELEALLSGDPERADPGVLEEYRFSAVEMLANALVALEVMKPLANNDRIFIPKRMEK